MTVTKEVMFAGPCFVDMHAVCKENETCACNCHATAFLTGNKFSYSDDSTRNAIGYSLYKNMPLSEDDSMKLVSNLYTTLNVTPADEEEVSRMVKVVHKFYHTNFGWSMREMLAHVNGKETA